MNKLADVIGALIAVVAVAISAVFGVCFWILASLGLIPEK